MNKTAKQIISLFIVFAFTVGQVLPIAPQRAEAQSVLNLPVPGVMVTPSQTYVPAILAGISLVPDNPLQFGFIVDIGDDQLSGEVLKHESNKLIKYFLAALTIPEDDMWVNLSPYEKNRIIAEGLGDTIMGRDMLAQDYILKQLTASLMYPEEELGEKFWKRIYEKARAKLGTDQIPTNTFNKIWIVPDEATVYVNETNVFVAQSRLRVMLEEDYLSLEHHDQQLKEHAHSDLTEETKEIIREVLIPVIEKEVNEGKNFAPLRQIYHSLILATWYKQNLKKSFLSQTYSNQNLIEGIDVQDKEIKNKIYEQYIKAFKKGVYNYIKEDIDLTSNRIIPRKYFSGGLNLHLNNEREVGTIEANVGALPDGYLKNRSTAGSPMALADTTMRLATPLIQELKGKLGKIRNIVTDWVQYEAEHNDAMDEAIIALYEIARDKHLLLPVKGRYFEQYQDPLLQHHVKRVSVTTAYLSERWNMLIEKILQKLKYGEDLTFEEDSIVRMIRDLKERAGLAASDDLLRGAFNEREILALSNVLEKRSGEFVSNADYTLLENFTFKNVRLNKRVRRIMKIAAIRHDLGKEAPNIYHVLDLDNNPWSGTIKEIIELPRRLSASEKMAVDNHARLSWDMTKENPTLFREMLRDVYGQEHDERIAADALELFVSDEYREADENFLQILLKFGFYEKSTDQQEQIMDYVHTLRAIKFLVIHHHTPNQMELEDDYLSMNPAFQSALYLGLNFIHVADWIDAMLDNTRAYRQLDRKPWTHEEIVDLIIEEKTKKENLTRRQDLYYSIIRDNLIDEAFKKFHDETVIFRSLYRVGISAREQMQLSEAVKERTRAEVKSQVETFLEDIELDDSRLDEMALRFTHLVKEDVAPKVNKSIVASPIEQLIFPGSGFTSLYIPDDGRFKELKIQIMGFVDDLDSMDRSEMRERFEKLEFYYSGFGFNEEFGDVEYWLTLALASNFNKTPSKQLQYFKLLLELKDSALFSYYTVLHYAAKIRGNPDQLTVDQDGALNAVIELEILFDHLINLTNYYIANKNDPILNNPVDLRNSMPGFRTIPSEINLIEHALNAGLSINFRNITNIGTIDNSEFGDIINRQVDNFESRLKDMESYDKVIELIRELDKKNFNVYGLETPEHLVEIPVDLQRNARQSDAVLNPFAEDIVKEDGTLTFVKALNLNRNPLVRDVSVERDLRYRMFERSTLENIRYGAGNRGRLFRNKGIETGEESYNIMPLSELADQLEGTSASPIENRVGGIDFNPGNLNIRQEGSFQYDILNVTPVNLETSTFNGIIPVIINITPIPNVLPLIGLQSSPTQLHISSLN